MLGNALDILRLLAESSEPLTATVISERIGLHTSNVSRTLRVLIDEGYVRKPSYHSFAPDLGLLALAGSVATWHPLCRLSAEPIRAAAERLACPVTFAGLFREQIVYLQRCAPGGDPISAGITSYPLHLSVVALRLILNLPRKEGLALLEASKRRYGWERPGTATPSSPAACLKAAAKAVDGDVLWLRDWDEHGNDRAAVSVSVENHLPLALACDGQVDPQVASECLGQTTAELRALMEQIA